MKKRGQGDGGRNAVKNALPSPDRESIATYEAILKDIREERIT